jgi:hypothetical protein
MKKINIFESFTNDDKWLSTFLLFLDNVWQEDAEIEIVSQLGEYRDEFENNPSATKDYFMRWVAQNDELVQRNLQLLSDKFVDEYNKLKNA